VTLATHQAKRWKRALAQACAALFLLAAPAALTADDQNPLARDPAAAKAGEYEFRINCALCHGLGARGGGRGPDLTRAQKKHAHSDADMFQVISNGIPGTVMPANGTNGQGVGMTDEEIWQIIAYIRSVEVKASGQAHSAMPRTASNFFMATRIVPCATWSRARGGRLGPGAHGGRRVAHTRVDRRFGTQSQPPSRLGTDRILRKNSLRNTKPSL
jgi:mono/diheme cytochrome c family protein